MNINYPHLSSAEQESEMCHRIFRLAEIGTLVTSNRSGFGSLVVSVLASGTPRSQAQTRPKPSDFSGEKNPQHAFSWGASKAVCLMSQICGMLNTPGNYVEVEFQAKFVGHFSPISIPRYRSVLMSFNVERIWG
jgi:hypothetical protein